MMKRVDRALSKLLVDCRAVQCGPVRCES